MGIITRMRKEKAVWWSMNGIDNTGKPTYGEPQEIDCRWEDMATRAISATGQEYTTAHIVYVDREMKPQDMLWRGKLEDAPDDPVLDFSAREIKTFDKLPKLSYKETLLTAKM